MNDQPRTLDRFVHAQRFDYEIAVAELRAGHKRSHWIWYVLPQLRGLGYSDMAHEYGLSGYSEALDYYNHEILGPRLVECVNAVLAHTNRSAASILGDVDTLKFRSCLTLFAVVAPQEPCFASALETFYSGVPDPETLKLLGLAAGAA